MDVIQVYEKFRLYGNGLFCWNLLWVRRIHYRCGWEDFILYLG